MVNINSSVRVFYQKFCLSNTLIELRDYMWYSCDVTINCCHKNEKHTNKNYNFIFIVVNFFESLLFP
jgi:hypothetical protein